MSVREVSGSRGVSRYGVVLRYLVLTGMALYLAWPVLAGTCACIIPMPSGISRIECAVSCAGDVQCCRCGILMSQCRCCLPGGLCGGTVAPPNLAPDGIGIAICTGGI
jgi:hypothetical protein